jgi:hypothetical protein
VYEYGVPPLSEKLEQVVDEASLASVELRAHLDAARAELIDVLREALAVHKNAIFNGESVHFILLFPFHLFNPLNVADVYIRPRNK